MSMHRPGFVRGVPSRVNDDRQRDVRQGKYAILRSLRGPRQHHRVASGLGERSVAFVVGYLVHFCRESCQLARIPTWEAEYECRDAPFIDTFRARRTEYGIKTSPTSPDAMPSLKRLSPTSSLVSASANAHPYRSLHS